MEEFWQNVKDLFILLIKVSLILLAIDMVCVFGGYETRIPFIGMVTDWILSKVAVFAG